MENVEFSTELGYHCISVNFKDKTCLNFQIDASFTVETDYSDWKTATRTFGASGSRFRIPRRYRQPIAS